MQQSFGFVDVWTTQRWFTTEMPAFPSMHGTTRTTFSFFIGGTSFGFAGAGRQYAGGLCLSLCFGLAQKHGIVVEDSAATSVAQGNRGAVGGGGGGGGGGGRGGRGGRRQRGMWLFNAE
jgi:hypothetical protein